LKHLLLEAGEDELSFENQKALLGSQNIKLTLIYNVMLLYNNLCSGPV